MRLIVRDLACERAGAASSRACRSPSSPASALMVTGPQRRRQIHPARHPGRAVRASAGTVGHESASGGVGGRRAAARNACTVVGHRDALKAALTAEENLAFAQRLYGDDRAVAPRRPRGPRASPTRPACRSATCRPDSDGGWRSRGFSSPTARSGFSTSRTPPSTPPRQAVLHGLMRGASATPAASSSPRPMGRCPSRDAREIRIERPAARAGVAE